MNTARTKIFAKKMTWHPSQSVTAARKTRWNLKYLFHNKNKIVKQHTKIRSPYRALFGRNCGDYVNNRLHNCCVFIKGWLKVLFHCHGAMKWTFRSPDDSSKVESTLSVVLWSQIYPFVFITEPNWSVFLSSYSEPRSRSKQKTQ